MTTTPNTPKLSVVIVNYNAARFLGSCLESLRPALQDTSHEIIVVDNASSDGSPDILHRMLDAECLILNNENRGFAAANNQAIQRALGRYILLLNPDTVTGRETIRSLLAFAEKAGPRAAAFGPTIVNSDGTFQRQCIRNFPTPTSALRHLFSWARRSLVSEARPYLPYETPPDEAIPIECLSGSALMVKRDALDDVGLLDEAFFIYAEDIDLCKRLKDAGWETWFVPTEPLMHYGGGSSELRSMRSCRYFYRSARIYYRKHYMGGKRIPSPVDVLVIAGIWLRYGLEMLGLLLRRRSQVGSPKPRPLRK